MKVFLPSLGRKVFTLAIFVSFCATLFAQTSVNPYVDSDAPQNSGIRFIENKNQWNSAVNHKLELNGGAVFFEKNALTYSVLSSEDLEAFHDASHPHGGTPSRTDGIVRGHAYKVNFANASPNVQIIGSGPYSDYRNYYIGKDESKWASNVLSYQDLLYRGIYNGIDLKFYAATNNPSTTSLKYDFIVHPGSNPSAITLKYDGLNNMYVNDGNLYLVTSVNTVMEQKPVAYQIIGGNQIPVTCHYKLTGNHMGFEFPDGYDTSHDLVIDPVLVFSTYTGSTADNFGFTATYDLQGNFYAGGIVYAVGYPTTLGAFQLNFGGVVDVGITKFNPTGTNLIFSTYLGGSNTELPSSLVVNSLNELIVLGTTGSSNFPTTVTAYDRIFKGGTAINFVGNGANFTAGSDIFVTKFNSTGTALGGSTFMGGTSNDGINQNSTAQLQFNYGDPFRGEVIVDSLNNIYVASSTLSNNFPVTAGVFQPVSNGGQEGVVFKLNTNLSSLLWSSYFGGTSTDAAYSLKLDGNNDVFICGGTLSTNLPGITGALNPNYLGAVDGYVAKINNNGNSLIRTTYIGTTSYDQCYFVDLDRFNNVYLYGQTRGVYPVSPGVYSNANTKQFLHKISNNLTTSLLSTTFGSGTTQPNISPTAFLVDQCGNIYASGWGGSTNRNWNTNTGFTTGMPTTPGAFQTTTDGSDFYFIVLGPDFSFLEYATFFGGNGSQEHVDGGTSRFDKRGAIYQAVCAGCGGTSLFPTTPGVWSRTNNSTNCNLGALKFDFQISEVDVVISPTPAIQGCSPLTVNFNDAGINAKSYYWNFGDGTTSTLKNPSHVFTNPGTYQVMLVGYDSTACQGIVLTDTGYVTIVARPATSSERNISICEGKSFFVGGALQTTAGTYRDTLVGPNGCDSVVITHLSLKPNQFTTVNASICPGESYFAGGALRTTPGTYRDTLAAANGCDSIITTNLTVLPDKFSTVDAFICPGESYFAGGALQTTEGTYRDTMTAANGCDSIITTHLFIRPFSVRNINADICPGESYFAGGALQTQTGVYRDTLTGSNGCDSIIVTNLTVKPIATTELFVSICEGESHLAGGGLQTQSGIYRDTLTGSNGCDSIIITNLTVKPVFSTNLSVSICEGESYFVGGGLQTQGGVYRDTLTASNGCDSVLITTLIIKPVFTTNLTASICPGESFFVGGGLQTQAGTYRDTLTASNGCDSILITILSIKSIATTDVSVGLCPGESYFAGGALQTTAGIYRDTLTGVNGCDSIIITTISIKTSTTTEVFPAICPGESYFAAGAFQTQTGIYRDTITNTSGCDSIIVTNLTVKPASTTIIDAAICPGESFYAGGEMQTKTGTYYDTLIAANGCDSVIITHLTIKPVSFTNAEVDICEGESFFVGGALQTQTGIYLDTLIAANGCDSIIITALTVKPHSFTNLNVSICPGDSYFVGGGLQTEEGTYTDIYPSANGCDSTVTTVLTFHPVYAFSFDTSICLEEPYKGNFYTADTVLIDSFTTVNGCDSIITTNLTVRVCCPAPIVDCRDTIIPDNQQYCGEFILAPPVVISQCNIVSLSNDYPGGPFPEGTTVVTWIAVDEFGQSDTCRQNVTYSTTGSLASYTILGFEHVELMPTNDVRTGSVGVMKPGGEAYLQNHTKITGPGSFVMAPVITTFPNTQVSNPIYAPANAVLPPFERNPHNYGLDVFIPVNTTVTLTDTVYGRISLAQGATVIFDNPHGILNLREIRVNNKAAGANTTLRFRYCMKIRVKERVDLGPKCTVNPDSLAVIFYVEAANTSGKDNQPVVDIGPNARVYADFYVPNGRFFAHPGSNVEPAQYIGTYIAKWITGQPDIIWRRKADCEHAYNCQGNKFKTNALAANEEPEHPLQIFPNPFRGQTTIGFTMKNKEDRVTLKVVNAAGALVSVLYDGPVDAGWFTRLYFDAATLSNGIYHVILQSSDGTYSKKLVVMN